MKTELKTYTIREIVEGFTYSELEEKGLFGLNGKLIIQPEYQRHFIYSGENGAKEKSVVDSVIRGFPIGLFYFNSPEKDIYEILDGQQRITSIGRFITNKFAIKDENGMEQYFSGIPKELQDKILNTKILAYICEGTEKEIKDWFKIININGLPLKPQEILNSVYSGEFVTLAKGYFSNSKSSNMMKWKTYVKGDPRRQCILETALNWVSEGNIGGYMSEHRHDKDINELKNYFNAVIEWANSTFKETYKEMAGLEWDRLYETFYKTSYDLTKLNGRIEELYNDIVVINKKGIFEYVLGGEKDTQLLQVRVFSPAIKAEAYNKQTEKAKAEGISNCPLCAVGDNKNNTKIYTLNEMEADHVEAWSKGGDTSIENCQVLCKTHNRAKGNK